MPALPWNGWWKLGCSVKDMTDAVMLLTDAATVTGHILYVDGGSHFGRW